jgi:hypothetical protein
MGNRVIGGTVGNLPATTRGTDTTLESSPADDGRSSRFRM